MEALTISDLVFLHCLWRSLSVGSPFPPHRPALSTELVSHIFRLAGFLVPSSTSSLSTSTSLTVKGSRHRPADVSRERWFSTPPFTRKTISKVAQVRLGTVSRSYQEHYRGAYWAEEPEKGRWAWFELAIYPASAPEGGDPRRAVDGKELVWVSHRPPAYRKVHQCSGGWLLWSEDGAKVSSSSEHSENQTTHSGDAFGPEHEIWSYLEEGDILAVRVCAQWPRWSNCAERGELMFWEFFEPCIPLHR